MNKSITQMSKKELIEVINDKNDTIEQLEKKIEGLELMAIASSATPLDSDISGMLETLAKQVRELEGKLNDQ
jgi:hypothetical protein